MKTYPFDRTGTDIRISGGAGCLGQAKEPSDSMAFLLSAAPSNNTGQDLAVDGGWAAW